MYRKLKADKDNNFEGLDPITRRTPEYYAKVKEDLQIKIDDFLLEISDRVPGKMSKLKQIEKQTGFDEESFEPRYKNALSLFAFTNALTKGMTAFVAFDKEFVKLQPIFL